MTIYELENARRRFENIKNAKKRRNGQAPLTLEDLEGMADWEDVPGIPFTAGEARQWLRYGAALREKYPGEESLDDIVERLLQAEEDDAKIRDFVASLHENKRKANEFVDALGNRRRSIWGDDPNAARAWDAPAARTNAEPPRWTPERTVWG